LAHTKPDVRAVLLMGGKGTRLAPYTTVLPKALVPIDDLPVAEILIRQLRTAGITDIALAVGHLAALIEAYFGDGSRWGVRLTYSREYSALGTAGPLALVPDLDSTFLVMNGDLLTTLDLQQMIGFHRSEAAVATIGVFQREIRIDLGVIEAGLVDVLGYVEKPTLSYEVSVGAYVMEPRALERIPSGEPYDLPDLIKSLIGAGEPVKAFRFDGHWLDIGNHDDYGAAVDLFQRERALFLPFEE
jgi:NDP-sugar pyrophosphorylase family protein